MNNMDNMDNERKIKRERNFLSYLHILKMMIKKYVIIIAVADTGAADYYTQDCAEVMMSFGLKVNMYERYRQPYIAIIDRGNVLTEKVSENTEMPLFIEGQLNNHEIIVYSAGFNYHHGIGFGAMVLIDGVNYLPSYNSRGFNFLIFDADNDRLVDSCAFDTFDMGKCTHNTNPLSQALQSFAEKNRSITICTFAFPRVPSKYNLDTSPWEKFIIENNVDMKNVIKNKAKMDKLWELEEAPFCHDYGSKEEFMEAFQTPDSIMSLDGNRSFLDYKSHVVNTENGVRVTLYQPHKAKRSIFLVGHCKLYGWGAIDAYTPASLLQKKLNELVPNKKFIVHNYSYIGTLTAELLYNLRSLPLKPGDIVILWPGYKPAIWGIPHCDLSLKSVRPHDYGEIFTDSTHHTHNGNQMIADGIFDFLNRNDFFEQKFPLDIETPINIRKYESEMQDEQLINYKKNLCDFFRKNISPIIGAVVMNCNPFTKGHRYLVEQALKKCDRLIVFVVEEDKSMFPFTERLDLVQKNLADLDNVSVLPSGNFIISSRTFKEYFNKESWQERNVDTSLDVTLFAKDIAPCLNISIRFAGEEPMDSVTRQYNESMARILPQYGIQFVEIPRIKFDGVPISASEVRRLLKLRKFDKLKEIVPLFTLQYLYRKFS